jgi:exopolysaccharide production protein ExoQ
MSIMSRSAIARDPLGFLIAAVAATIPIIAVFASKAVVPALAAFAVLGLAAWLIEGHRPRISPVLAALLAALVALGAISVLWAKAPTEVYSQIIRFVAIFAAGGVAVGAIVQAPDLRRTRVLLAFAVGQSVAMAALLFEFLTGAAIMRLFYPVVPAFYFSTGTAVLALFAWPAALVLGRRTGRIGTGLLLLIVMCAIGFRSASLAVGVGFACGLIAAVMTGILRRRAVYGLAALTVITILAAPLIADALPRPDKSVASDTMVPHGVFPRLIIWDYVTDRIAERPLAGWGLNSSRTFSSGADQVELQGPWAVLMEPIPLHPHNAYLQWWLELGLLGAAVGAATVAWIMLRAGDMAAGLDNAVIGVGVTVTGLVIAGLSFGAWQSWWLSTFWVTGAMIAAARISTRARNFPRG